MFIEKRDTRRTERDSCDSGKYGCKGFSKMLREMETRRGGTLKTKGELDFKPNKVNVQGAVEPIFARQGNGSEEKHQKKIYRFATYPLLHFLPPTKISILFQRKN